MRRISVALLGLLLPLADLHAALVSRNFQIQPTPAGRLDSRFPDGDDGALVNWNTIPNVAVQNGSGFTLNLATYLNQPGSPAATIAPGCTPSLPAGGVSVSGTTISATSTTTISLTCRPVATRSGIEYVYPTSFTITSEPGAAVDSLAPPVPVGLTATPGVGTVQLAWRPSCDNFAGGLGSGVTGYDLRVGTSVIASPTHAGCSAGQLTVTNIGSVPSPTFTQSGNGWNAVVGGAGWEGTADQIVGAFTQVTGAFMASIRVTSIDAGNWTKGGIDVRESLDPGSRSFPCVVQRSAAGTYVNNVRPRTTTGGSRSSVANTPISGPGYLLLVRDESGLLTCGYSADGTTFANSVANFSLPMDASVYVGPAASSTAAGTDRAVTMENFILSTAAVQTYTHTTTTGGNYTVRAKDGAGNASAYSTAVAAAPEAASSGAARKFNPGHYASVCSGMDLDNTQAQLETFLTRCERDIREAMTHPGVRGVQIILRWALLEGPVAGQYDFSLKGIQLGIPLVQRLRNVVANAGGRLMIIASNHKFGGTGPSDTLPAYIINGAQYGYTVFNTGSSVGLSSRSWQPATNARKIALAQAYAAAFNDDPYFELYGPMGETALAISEGTDGYTRSAYTTQINELYNATRAAWPNTAIRLNANFGGTPLLASTIANCVVLECVVGGPDVIPSQHIAGNDCFAGQPGFSGCSNRRGVIPWLSEVQSPSLGGKEGDWTPAQLFTHARAGGAGYYSTTSTTTGANAPAMYTTYMVWKYMDYRETQKGDGTGDDQMWITGIGPYVTSINGQITSGSSASLINFSTAPCPYSGGCQ